MRLVWLTDIHLDFLTDERIAAFGREVADHEPDAVVVTGDISVAPELANDLRNLVARWSWPCHFVCGNHDYYGASIETVRTGLRTIHQLDRRLSWLPHAGVVRLTEETSLIGVDGWADGVLGDGPSTPIVLNDHLRIEELLQPCRAALLETVAALGRAEAERLRQLLGEALAPAQEVIVATHVPPFRESSTHEGKLTDDDWLPWMTCHAVGEALRELARAHPTRKITVLAGHTHDRCRVRIEDNLEVRTGKVEYGKPRVEEVLVR